MDKLIDSHLGEWQQHVTAYRNGKLSRAAYCKLHNLRYSQFGYWVEKYKKLNLIPVRIAPKPTEASFVNDLTILCTLLLKHGTVLKIHDLKALNLILELYTHAL